MELDKTKRVLLRAMEGEFDAALQNKDFQSMAEIYAEIKRIEMGWGDMERPLTIETFFAQLSPDNTIPLPIEGINALGMSADSKLVIYLSRSGKYIVVDINTSPIKDIREIPDVVLAKRIEMNEKREIRLPEKIKQRMDLKSGDLLKIEILSDDFTISKYQKSL